jgi:peptidoglycan/xylan/chitin deacetylase (PgdA/CDA1 family)/folate-dependent phosphoribosylglycinamide formyltransferase PurN
MSKFRIIIFTSIPPAKVRHFLWRLYTDLPEVEVAGILYETERPPLPFNQRLKRVKKYFRDPDFIRFTARRIAAQIKRRGEAVLPRLLHVAHGTKGSPNTSSISLKEFAGECEEHGTSFHITEDIHNEASLEFLKALKPDLGVIYGTRILKPHLFSAPRLGSINIHKHKVPEYRGTGAPGLWELRDDKTEQTVTIHRVTKNVDAGAVLCERSFPIGPLDTLTSLSLKADLIGIDCLIDTIRRESLGESTETPQPPSEKVYKGFQPHQIWAIEEGIRKRRKPFKPQKGRPFLKLATRTLAYPALSFKNRRRARDKRFPVVILFHHLISDRECFLGMPTDNFLRQVRFLKEHYRIASLSEALGMLKKGEVESPTVVLTFDDGYGENFLGLRAVAEAENIPVTLFVCTRHVTEQAEFQHDIERREHGFPALSWEELRYLDQHNVSIGSHTRTHFDCGDLDESRLHEEIVGSLEDLRRELGHDVLGFAFPKGYPQNMSEPARSIALQTYPYVFSAFGGVNYPPLSTGVILKRSGLPQSLFELELALQGILDFDQYE